MKGCKAVKVVTTAMMLVIQEQQVYADDQMSKIMEHCAMDHSDMGHDKSIHCPMEKSDETIPSSMDHSDHTGHDHGEMSEMGDLKNDQKVDEEKQSDFSSDHSGHSDHHSMAKENSEVNKQSHGSGHHHHGDA